MKDIYPSDTTIPADSLVPRELQPDYPDIAFPAFDGACNVGDCLADLHVRAGRGDLIAAIHAETGRSYSFAALAQESSRLAAGLVRWGIKVGDRVAYRTVNDPDALVVMLAIWKAGGVVVPVPAQARGGEIRHFIDDTEARLLFLHSLAGPVDEIIAALMESSIAEVIGFGDGHGAMPIRSWRDLKVAGDFSPPSVSPDQVAIIWHTGGTTGRPKGCYHTHKRFLLGGYSYGLATGAGVGQRWAAAAPIGHALGIIHNTIFTLLHGATAVFIEKFSDPGNLLRAVDQHKLTVLTALMVSWARMAEVIEKGDAPGHFSSLQRCYAMWQSASAGDTYDFWLKRGIELLNNFGSTAFANWVLVPPLGAVSPRAALGQPAPGYSVEAVEVIDGKVRPVPPGAIGRMAVKGPTGLTYWNMPELQARDVVEGWTLSDDLIRYDAEGNAHYLGRTDYLISTAGYKVAPVEVEEVLARHPAVLEVAVVPAPDPVRQEMVVAFIALNPTASPGDELKAELCELVKANLSSYKAPRRIEFIDALPRDSVGKVQTRIVKQWADK